MSVNRKDHIDRARLEEMMSEDPRSRSGYLGYIAARCDSVRGIMLSDDSARHAYHVYDTGLQDDSSHADICQTSHRPDEKPLRLAACQKMSAAFGRIVSDLSTVYA